MISMTRFVLLSLFVPLSAATLSAQDIRVADSLYRAGQRALEAGDTAGYRRNSDSAASMMPAGNLNRPFVQYHAARGNAMVERSEASGGWLGRMLDENIEGLMAWYSSIDSGFDRIRSSEPYQAIVRRMNTLELQQTPLGHGLLLLEGAGGNVVVAPSAEGVLVVDAGYEPGGRAIARTLPQGTRAQWVVLTHAHEDHVGGATALVRDAVVLAHPETIKTLQSSQEFIPGVSAPASPLAQTMQPISERRVIHLRRDSAVVIPLPAHSGGDLLVWFPEARVLATGDNFLPGANPFLELGGIQDIQGYIAAMVDVINPLPPDTKIVPGHGKVATLEEFLAIYEKTRDGIEFVRAKKAAGIALADIKTEGATLGLPGPWIERAYRRVR
jgi:glyoxylase-like metal-dependent hydrolase (beta-lactamase superfamily II)